MDRLFREEGVIDPEEDELMEEDDQDEVTSIRSPGIQKEGLFTSIKLFMISVN
jgi:hypothetical protein